MYFIKLRFAASFKAISASAEQGTIVQYGNSFFNFSKFFSEPGTSILFAASIIGFEYLLSSVHNDFISSWLHEAGASRFSFSFVIAELTISSVIFTPENCL